MNRSMGALCAFLALMICADTAVADDQTLTAAVPLKKARKEEPRQGGTRENVDFAIFIPDGVKVIRGAVVNPFYVDTVKQTHWQEACRLWGFALIGSNHFGVAKDEFASTMQSALDEWAARSNRPELKHIPFCFVGMSAGGGMSRQFALAMPDRTIAVAPVCLEVAPDEAPLRAIPFLNVFGEKDGQQMSRHLEKLPVNRQAGALWGIAVQWGRKHEFGQANNLVLPFFDDVIRQRLPDQADPSAGPVTLKPAAIEAAWLGDVGAWAEKTKTGVIAPAKPENTPDQPAIPAEQACWFPSARVAAAWRAFVSADKRLTIPQPAGLGDKQPFTPLTEGKLPVVITCEIAGAKEVSLYNGQTQIASRPMSGGGNDIEFTVELPAGIHPLYATAETEAGTRYSRVHTVIVK